MRDGASREFGVMILQGLPPGSAAEVLGDEAGEEGDGIEEGFGFGDGYDFGADTGRESLFEAISDEAAAGVAVEADIGELGVDVGIVSEDKVAGVCVIVDWRSILRRSTPVPDRQSRIGRPRAYATEAQSSAEAREIDGGVGTEGEKTHRLVEVSTYGYAASIEIDGGGVVHGVLCRDEEGAAVEVDV